MNKWEYKVITLIYPEGNELENFLNEQGEEGWEVVQINERNSEIILKREKK